LKKKIIDRKHNSPRTASAAPNPDGHVQAAPAPVRIVNARRYNVKPMTAEEAALELADKTDNFIVFRDADTSRVGVLYQRQDGNFGLIEPRSEEHTSELQSPYDLVCRLLLEKKKTKNK